LNFGYDFNSEWGLNAYVTNPNDRGILSGNGIQYGLQLVKSSAVFRLAPGFLFNFDSSSQKMNYYLDLVTGITVGNLSMDGEISFNSRNDIINPETNLGTQGLGGLLQILYALNASTNFGTRMEYITNQALNDPKGSPSQNALKSQILIFIGPQYTLTKNIRLKLDYSYQLDTAFITQAQTPYHGLQLAGVLRF